MLQSTTKYYSVLKSPRWNAIDIARSNRCHPPASPNTAPATKSHCHHWSLSHMKRQMAYCHCTPFCHCTPPTRLMKSFTLWRSERVKRRFSERANSRRSERCTSLCWGGFTCKYAYIYIYVCVYILYKIKCYMTPYQCIYAYYCWWLKSCTAWHVAYGRVVAFPPTTPLISRLCLHEGWCRISAIQKFRCFMFEIITMLKLKGCGETTPYPKWCKISAINRIEQ